MGTAGRAGAASSESFIQNSTSMLSPTEFFQLQPPTLRASAELTLADRPSYLLGRKLLLILCMCCPRTVLRLARGPTALPARFGLSSRLVAASYLAPVASHSRSYSATSHYSSIYPAQPPAYIPQPDHSTTPAAELLSHYSQLPTRVVTLEDLTRYGSPPLSEEALLESGERTRVELLKGLARRVSAVGIAERQTVAHYVANNPLGHTTLVAALPPGNEPVATSDLQPLLERLLRHGRCPANHLPRGE